MRQLLSLYMRSSSTYGTYTRLPGWCRLGLFVLALPGLVLAGLSIAALGVSILALLLLTAPAYRLFKVFARPEEPAASYADVAEEMVVPPRRRVDVTIIDE